jgi:tripartite-type tricarboxylate transporter receptor subunit TctC
MKLIEQAYGVKLRQVPYKGGAPAAADLIAGHVPMMIGSVTALGAFVRDGKARALVQLGAARHPLLPETPTLAELGQKGFTSEAWIGIFVPAGTVDGTVTRFNTELKAVLQDTWVRERMAAIGVQLTGSSPEQLGSFVKAEMARWGAVVRTHDIKPE